MEFAYYFGIVLMMVALFITMTVHELGHFFAALKYGVKAPEIGFGFRIPRKSNISISKTIKGVKVSLNPILIGAFVRIGPEELDCLNSPYKKIFVLAAGSLVNIAVGIILLFIAGIIKGLGAIEAIIFSLSSILGFISILFSGLSFNDLGSPIGVVDVVGTILIENPEISLLLVSLIVIASINISIGLLNLIIPIPPLDGGYIFFTILIKIFGEGIYVRILRLVTTLAGIAGILILTIFVIGKDIMALI